jgi:hypothetical protein
VEWPAWAQSVALLGIGVLLVAFMEVRFKWELPDERRAFWLRVLRVCEAVVVVAFVWAAVRILLGDPPCVPTYSGGCPSS